VSGWNSLAATGRTDDFARNRDRKPEVSRGHSRGMQAGEGLKALQSERRSELINRTVVPPEGPNGPR
jgi:hypothetical protein